MSKDKSSHICICMCAYMAFVIFPVLKGKKSTSEKNLPPRLLWIFLHLIEKGVDIRSIISSKVYDSKHFGEGETWS